MLLLAGLGLRLGQDRAALRKIHEIRVLETAREMVAAGDLVVPRFLGAPRLEKPPLPYWSTAPLLAAGAAPSEQRMRWILAPLLLILVGSVASLGATLHDARHGRRAAVVAAASFLAMGEYGKVTPDAFLAAFCALSAAGAAAAARAPGRRAVAGFAIAVLGAALALLSKGPIALLWCGLAAAVLIPRARDEGAPSPRRGRRALLAAAGVLLALAPLAIWAALVIDRLPDAAGTWWDELRLHGGGGEKDTHGPLTYLGAVLVASAPHTLAFLAAAFARTGGARRERIWLGAGLVILLLLSSKKTAYFLPLLPPVSLLAARGLDATGRIAGRLAAANAGLVGVGALAAGPVLAAFLFRFAGETPPAAGEIAASAILGAAGLLAATLLWRGRRDPARRAGAVLLAGLVVGATFGGADRLREHDRHALERRALGRAARAELARGGGFFTLATPDDVVAFHADALPRPIATPAELPPEGAVLLIAPRDDSPPTGFVRVGEVEMRGRDGRRLALLRR
ncbi:MAG: glycosyltransferase family 39 protein [Planctomycetota bacterium]